MTEHILALLSRTEVWVGGLALAGFLVLFWTLRGAPIGQGVQGESDEAPRGGYRDRVIASIVLGLMLIVSGAYVAIAHQVQWSLPLFALGFGIVLTLIAVNRRYRHGSPTLRRTMDLANAALTASLLAGVLIVGNVLAFRYGGRPLDFTREHAFSLSDITVKQLRALSRPLTFTVFFGESPRAVLQHDRVKQLLERYKDENPERIKVEYLNPYQDVEKFNTLAKRAPEIPVSLSGGGILIEYGSGDAPEHVVLRNNDLFEFPQGARTAGNSATFETAFKGEDAVTSALVRLREGKKVKVAFTSGHGETPPDQPDIRKPGLASFKSRLSALGSDVNELNLGHEEIPSDLALLMIVAPKTPFQPDEVVKLRAYVNRGGPLLLLVGNQNPSGLDDLLKTNNLALGKGVVVDPVLNRNRIIAQVEVPVSNLTQHPIVESLANRFVLFPYAAPLKIAPQGAANPTVTAYPILRTGPEAWAETDLSKNHRPVKDKDDDPGPIIVAAAVYDRPAPGSREPEGKPRMVVIASPSVADNFVLDSEPTNLDFLMNSVSWLQGRSDLIGIKPNQHIALTLTADSILRNRLILVPTVAALLLILGLGATTYVARRE